MISNGLDLINKGDSWVCSVEGCTCNEVAFRVIIGTVTYNLCGCHAIRWTDGIMGHHRFEDYGGGYYGDRCVYCGITREKNKNIPQECWAS